MRILIDIGHPAHVHYFKNFIKIMESKGHKFLIVAKNRNVTHDLLAKYEIDFVKRKDFPKNIIFKLLSIPFADFLIVKYALKFKPDLFLGFSGTHISHAGWLLRIPSIIFDDTDNANIAHLSYVPFASVILTPMCFSKNFGKKHLYFNSYMEVSYLHPAYFIPKKSILSELGIAENEMYSIVRFVKWHASHDMGHSGLSLGFKILLVESLLKFGKVFISSESELPKELEQYRYPLGPETLHSAMAYANLLYGESATMASECSIIGTPSIYHDNEGRSYTREQEANYGLVHNYLESVDEELAGLEDAIRILKDPNSKAKSKELSHQLLNEKIDTTAFMVWFIENYPNSISILRKDPEYQNRFIKPIIKRN